MNRFIKQVSVTAMVVTVIGVGTLRAGPAEAPLVTSAGSYIVNVSGRDVYKHAGFKKGSLKYKYYSGSKRHSGKHHFKKKRFAKNRLHGAGPRHSGFHKHGDFGHSHGNNGPHRH